MSLRFHRSIKLCPGVKLNLGMSGAGVSIGPRGLHVGMNRRGVYTSAGIPGSGLYVVHHVKTGASERPQATGKASTVILAFFAVAALLAILKACR